MQIILLELGHINSDSVCLSDIQKLPGVRRFGSFTPGALGSRFLYV